MKWDEKSLHERYLQIDLDENDFLQRKIYEQICAKKHSFKRNMIGGLCAAGAAAAVLIAVWLFLPHKTTYLPDPAAFDRMQFAFYRELALPGQDLGISYDDFPAPAATKRS